MAAGIAEVTVDRNNGRISVPWFRAAVDADLIISPDNADTQVKGSIVYGLSSVRIEHITIAACDFKQSDFYDYEIMRANDVPEIDIHIEVSDRPASAKLGMPMTVTACTTCRSHLTACSPR